jgi:hypothetical protein
MGNASELGFTRGNARAGGTVRNNDLLDESELDVCKQVGIGERSLG